MDEPQKAKEARCRKPQILLDSISMKGPEKANQKDRWWTNSCLKLWVFGMGPANEEKRVSEVMEMF